MTTYIRMIRCPICESSPLHFYLIFSKNYYVGYHCRTSKELHFNSHYSKYDRKCEKCNRVYKSGYFRHGGKQNKKQVLQHSQTHRELSPIPYTAQSLFCETQSIDDYLKLTPYKKRAQDIPFEEGIKIPADFHEEFTQYKKKYQEELLKE